MKRTISTNKRLYGLIGQLSIDQDTKEEMILSMSNGRTMHSSELTESEAKQLIEKLENSDPVKHEKTISRINGELEQKFRRNIFKLMYDIGLINASMENGEKLEYINTWIKNKMKLDKDLNSLTFDELTTLIKQLQAVRRNYMERSTKQAMYN